MEHPAQEKTTTVDLLLKLFEPQSGEIFIDGQKLSEMDGASVRRSIGMVAADGTIFRGTLSDNIRYKKPEASDEEVEAAAIAAGMLATLQRLPDGLQTLVGESGFGLSVGERQRVQIARVIVSKPIILVMDEATANLDYATEAEVKKTIEEMDDVEFNNYEVISNKIGSTWWGTNRQTALMSCNNALTTLGKFNELKKNFFYVDYSSDWKYVQNKFSSLLICIQILFRICTIHFYKIPILIISKPQPANLVNQNFFHQIRY